MESAEPPSEEIDSEFEPLETGGTTGRPLFRGTHHYDRATVERTYYVEDGVLNVETAYLDGGTEVTTVTESWLLDGDRLRHTGEPVAQFCRNHHFEAPATDVRFCLDGAAEESDPLPETDVRSTFQPATAVTVEEGAALRYEGVHRAGGARVKRSFFVNDTDSCLRVRTTYFWDEERLGSLEQRRELLEDGFVAATGEPVEAFCRRTHLVDPESDVRYCARLGTAGADTGDERAGR
ncbi:hypothetical protein HSBGL_0682 [Halapricum desulfuricans]|uniref:Uncharacterized protein n=1 Tax=Halapricum desulfuricans TaxID=2841257 RepID=A0A897NLM3_9EURY|nr:hypothetical protein [Halapricum desulfuricans]QSG11116.1 hypothetical protein HSBGL_0682 [Halapricum desulfuricans]